MNNEQVFVPFSPRLALQALLDVLGGTLGLALGLLGSALGLALELLGLAGGRLVSEGILGCPLGLFSSVFCNKKKSLISQCTITAVQ